MKLLVCISLLTSIAATQAVTTFATPGGPSDIVGSWYSEEWSGTNTSPGGFAYQAKDGTVAFGYYLTHQCATVDGFPGWHAIYATVAITPGSDGGDTTYSCESGYVSKGVYFSFSNSTTTACPLASTSESGVSFTAYASVPGTSNPGSGSNLGITPCATPAQLGIAPGSAPVTASGASDSAVKTPAEAPLTGSTG